MKIGIVSEEGIVKRALNLCRSSEEKLALARSNPIAQEILLSDAAITSYDWIKLKKLFQPEPDRAGYLDTRAGRRPRQ